MNGFQDKLPIEYRDLIYRGVESDELDYKAAMNWNKIPRAGRAKIVRHAIALANTKGGYVVIGVGEDASGHPSVYTGLSREEAHSFDPSIVGPFINRHVEPPIDFTIERPVVDGKRYAVFVVRPFSAMPHVCAYGIEGELQQGVFYIRTTDASSRAAVRAIEMHGLIQRALRNQRELLGRMLRGILYDTRSNARETPVSRFEDEATTIRNYYLHRHPIAKDDRTQVRLEFSVFPQEYDAERFGFGALRHAAESAASLLPGQAFLNEDEVRKGYCTNTALRIFSENSGRICQLNKSGSLYFSQMLPTPNRKLESALVVKLIAEAVNFVSRLYSELGFVEQMLELRVGIGNTDHLELLGEVRLPGRRNTGGNAEKEYPAICQISEVRCFIRRTAADLASGREAHAARLFREIGERFNLPEKYYRNLPRLIRGYLEKR